MTTTPAHNTVATVAPNTYVTAYVAPRPAYLPAVITLNPARHAHTAATMFALATLNAVLGILCYTAALMSDTATVGVTMLLIGAVGIFISVLTFDRARHILNRCDRETAEARNLLSAYVAPII